MTDPHALRLESFFSNATQLVLSPEVVMSGYSLTCSVSNQCGKPHVTF